jgi:hypothetical protein
MWCLWGYSSNLLRPKDPPGPGPVLRGYARLLGRGDSPRRLPKVPEGEAGKAGVAGRLSLLHQAICVLHRPSLPGFQYSGCSQGIPSGLEDGQGLSPYAGQYSGTQKKAGISMRELGILTGASIGAILS